MPSALLKAAALTVRPEVKLEIETCFVSPDWTIGNTSVPTSGVVDAGSCEIFKSAMSNPLLNVATKTGKRRGRRRVSRG